MSGFNWFRRSYDDSQDTEAPPPEAPAPEKPEENDTSGSQGMSPEERLQWAKAAFQAIQQRQQEQDAKLAESESSEADEEAASEYPLEPPPDDEAVGVEQSLREKFLHNNATAVQSTQAGATETGASANREAVADISQTLEPTPSEGLISELAAAAKTDQGGEQITIPQVTGVNQTAKSQEILPFWAKADAERQARLERLKETAIVESAPESKAKPEPVPSSLLLDFDEAFLWSAEVLAAQGRSPDQISVEEITWLSKLRQGLQKTRLNLINQLKLIVGQGPLNQDGVDEIEALLLQADVGVEATDHVIEVLQKHLRQEVLPPEQAIAYLKRILQEMLDKPLEGEHNLTFVPDHNCLNIWLMTGVNGAGKTTTIGKLAHIAKKSEYRCLIAAADTFRAAAVEQVKAWGARSGVDVIANPGKNTDPAAVVYDAIAAAQSRQTELLLVDTAGRLQNKKNLMAELAKVRRIIDKKAADARVESLLVLDATLGQNGLRQAQVFSEAANLSGVVLTKLDGTAKGGVALAVVQQLGLPIRFIGAGEGIEDLRPFSSYEFVEALLSG